MAVPQAASSVRKTVVCALLAILAMAAQGCSDDPPLSSEPAGDEIAFICDTRYSLCAVRLSDGEVRLITDDIQTHSFGWSPAGDRLVVATIGLYEFEDGRHVAGEDLYLVDADGGDVEQLTSDEHHDANPAWSPDGRLIAFSSDRDLERTSETAGGRGSIYVVDLDDRSVRRVTYGSGDEEPTWSPDGKEIAFIRGADVWIVSADGTTARRLPISRPQFPTSLSWSPDGHEIAVGDFSGGDIYVVSADGSGSRPLGLDPPVQDVDTPSWSPDGSRIAFAGADDCRAVFVARVGGGGARQVSSCEREHGLADSPKWRPDGA